MFVGKKIFFFHGVGDINIFVKQNYLKEIDHIENNKSSSFNVIYFDGFFF